MATPVYVSDFAEDILDALVAASGLLENAKIKLFVGSQPVSKSSVLADFTEASFDGYAEKTITWVKSKQGTDKWALNGGLQLWVATGSTVAEQIGGFLIVDSGGTILYGGQQFDTTVPVGDAGDKVEAAPVFTL